MSDLPSTGVGLPGAPGELGSSEAPAAMDSKPPVTQLPPQEFPLSWLLQRAGAPIQFRALTEVARLASVPRTLPALVYTHRPALRLVIAQSADGGWNDAILRVPRSDSTDQFSTSVGTVPAFRRLLEYGWDREAPPLVGARRQLFRLLAEDADPHFLYELSSDGREQDSTIRSRGVLRVAAAAALAQAGYEPDPRLRGAARRLIDRVDRFISTALSDESGSQGGAAEPASTEPIPPSTHFLLMLAHMPHFLLEHGDFVGRLSDFLSRRCGEAGKPALRPAPTRPAVTPYFVLGDPLASHSAAMTDIGFALYWLETMARLGILRRHLGWTQIFDRLLEDRDRDGVWQSPKGPAAVVPNAVVWPAYPLNRARDGDVSVDVTFRLGMIGRLIGREIVPV